MFDFVKKYNIESYVHVLELLSFKQNKLWKFEIKDKGLLSQIVVHFVFQMRITINLL